MGTAAPWVVYRFEGGECYRGTEAECRAELAARGLTHDKAYSCDPLDAYREYVGHGVVFTGQLAL